MYPDDEHDFGDRCRNLLCDQCWDYCTAQTWDLPKGVPDVSNDLLYAGLNATNGQAPMPVGATDQISTPVVATDQSDQYCDYVTAETWNLTDGVSDVPDGILDVPDDLFDDGGHTTSVQASMPMGAFNQTSTLVGAHTNPFPPARVFTNPDTPWVLFHRSNTTRFFRVLPGTNDCQLLIYVSGVKGQGRHANKAGCSFRFGPITRFDRSRNVAVSQTVSFRMERLGPEGREMSNDHFSARIRAAIAALEYLPWHLEGFRSIVIACNSDYVVSGITTDIYTWMRNGWMESDEDKRKDLWLRLLKSCNEWAQKGVEVFFWKTQAWANKEPLARQVAEQSDEVIEWQDIRPSW